MRNSNTGSIVVLIIFLINMFVGGYATEYVIEFWAGFAKGVVVDVPFLPCFVGGIFLGQFTIPLAVLTWIISFIL